MSLLLFRERLSKKRVNVQRGNILEYRGLHLKQKSQYLCFMLGYNFLVDPC